MKKDKARKAKKAPVESVEILNKRIAVFKILRALAGFSSVWREDILRTVSILLHAEDVFKAVVPGPGINYADAIQSNDKEDPDFDR